MRACVSIDGSDDRIREVVERGSPEFVCEGAHWIDCPDGCAPPWWRYWRGWFFIDAENWAGSYAWRAHHGLPLDDESVEEGAAA